MFQVVDDHTQGQSLCGGEGLLTVAALHHDSRAHERLVS